MQTKALDNLKTDVAARRAQVATLEKQLKKAKSETKKHEQKIQDFIQELQKIMQKDNDNEKIAGLMHIHKANAKDHADEVLEKKKKDPETIEELDKHLKYMEKSISQLKKSTQVQLAKSRKQIRKQTKDNKDLIRELSVLRKEDKTRKEGQDAIDKKINKINQEKRRVEGEIEKYKDSMRKMRL